MRSKEKIGITGWGSISPLGMNQDAIWEAYKKPVSLIRSVNQDDTLVATLQESEESFLADFKTKDKNYKYLDKSVLMAMAAVEQVLNNRPGDFKNTGINMGSSRGATALFEQHYQHHISDETSHLHPLTSPSTTLGNISSWAAYHNDLQGVNFSHSVTCSTALHAILNGIAWLRSGMCHSFIAGGSEAPLTDFTISQMRALRIYSNLKSARFPCLALDDQKDQNTMVLGEGSACFMLDINPLTSIAYIKGIGYGQEKIRHATAISHAGKGFQKAMEMALEQAGLASVDAIVCHAPGTQKGDQAERNAIKAVFYKNIPLLTSNKWKIGHTLGASGALSLEFALLMLLHNTFINVPYLDQYQPNQSALQHIMINAAGFGGNVVSIIVSRD